MDATWNYQDVKGDMTGIYVDTWDQHMETCGLYARHLQFDLVKLQCRIIT